MIFGYNAAQPEEKPSPSPSSPTIPSIEVNSPTPPDVAHRSPALTVTASTLGITNQAAPKGASDAFADGPWNGSGGMEKGAGTEDLEAGGSGHLQVPGHIGQPEDRADVAAAGDALDTGRPENAVSVVPGQQPADGNDMNVLVVQAKTDAEIADEMLTDKEKNKLAKDEAKADKKLTKMLKAESKLSKQTLSSALKELSELQGRLRAAISDENRASAMHNKAVASVSKAEAAYHAAKTRWEKQKVDVAGREEALEGARKRSKEAKERVDEARKAVEGAREGRIADERERGVKLAELAGRTIPTRRSVYFGSLRKP